MRDRLEGQVAIVTGAAQGMGAACSRRLAEEGAAVALVDLNEAGAKRVADEIVSRGGVATATGTDVTDEAQVGAMVQSAVSEHGPVGILVNCAGVIFRTRISDITKAEWDKVLDVNLNGTFLCCAATLGGMKENHYGRIVNISSTAGRSVSTLGGAHYTASKAAVIGFTRAVAKETGPFGITSNAICPGLIDTEMVRENCSPEQLRAYADSFPIQRLGSPEEVADLTVFLVAEGGYITGACLDISGGDLMA